MSTAFQSIAAALLSALSAAPALANGRVYANRLQPLPAIRATAVVVRLESTSSRETALGALDWTSVYAVECYGRGAIGADPAEAVDGLLQDVWARLVALDASALGAMAVNVNAAIEWQYDEAETPMACAIVRLAVQHRTPVATLQPWS